MELIVLGADGTYPSPGGACSGYLVREGGFSLWMDAGNGTLGRLQQHIGIADVGAVFLSHLHPDHCVDLYPFFYALRFHGEAPIRELPVFAPPGAREALGGLFMDEARAKLGEVFTWHEVAPGDAIEIGPFRVSTFEGAHTTTNLMARLTAAGRALCYTGDTGPAPAVARAAEGADLFLCEASWQDADEGDRPIHLRARQAAAAAREAGAARLVLTHIWPRLDPAVSLAQASEEFSGPTDLAAPAGRWTL